MSRLGRIPIDLPKGVDVKAAKDGMLEIKGPKGSLRLQLPLGLQIKIEGQVVTVEHDEKIPLESAMHGLYRSLLKNAVVGVSEGHEIKLSLIGVGYRANVQGALLDLQVGFSHPMRVAIPKTIQVTVDKGISIVVKGADKQEVGQFAATVRSKKKPEPYKGKGIRYENEYVRKKEGKAAKGKA